MSSEHTHDAGRHAIRHVARLCDCRHEVIAFGGKEECRMPDLMQPAPDIVVSQELESIEISVAGSAASQLDESLHFRAMRLTRVQLKCRQLPHQTQGSPGQ